VAGIFFYHRLKLESELVVLQSAGLSRAQLAMPIFLSATIALVIGYTISLFILPISSREFREMQFFLRTNYVSVLLQEGVFSSPVDGLTVYVRAREGDNTFRGILVHDNRNPASQITMMAEKALLEDTAEGPRFLLTKGNRQELRDGKISFLEFDSYTLDIGVYTNANQSRKTDSDELSIFELFSKTASESNNLKDFRKERAEAHQRILWPAMSLTLGAIVAALTLSGEFNRRQRWKRNVLTTMCCGAVLLGMVAMRGAMSSNSYWVFVAYALLILPFAGASAFLFTDSHRTSSLKLRRAA
jgi:lipopolysaccharide export system permease protein